MSTTAAVNQPRYSPEEIENWIVSWVARETKVPPEQISRDEEFVNLGLKSRSVIVLVGELEDFTGLSVDPALAWEYPSIRQFAAHLGENR